MSESGCVIVTGASRGIGLATAIAFASQRRQVVLNARDEGALTAAADKVGLAGGDCLPIVGDVGEPGNAERLIQAALDAYTHIDVVVNNAGAAPMAAVQEMSHEEFRTCISANIESTFYMTQSVWPHFQERGSGVIVNLSSMSAIDPFPGFSVYGACKAWVEKFTAAAATEGKPQGIRVYGIGPGAVETSMLRGIAPDFPADQTLAPEDIANTILSVAVDSQWQYSSGQTIYVRK